MDTFADYLLNEKQLSGKIDILNRLQRLLKERKGMTLFFYNSTLLKTEIARLFLEHTHIGNKVDKNLVLTSCLLCNCKKIDGPQTLESLHSYAKNGAEFVGTLGFDKRFCKICEEVNRYSGSQPREPEGDILELVDNFGGMIIDRPERAGFSPEKSIIQMETDNLRGKNNRYFEQFKEFVHRMQEIEVAESDSHVGKKVFRYMRDSIMETPLASVMVRIPEMEKLVDEKILDKKKEEKSNIPLFEDGTLDMIKELLNDVKVQRGTEEEKEV